MTAKGKKIVKYNGKKQCIYRWAEELNMSVQTLYTRASRGWADHEIIEGRPRPDGAAVNSGPTKASVSVVYKGITYGSLTELAKATGVPYQTIYMRHYRGCKNAFKLVHGVTHKTKYGVPIVNKT